MHIFTLSEDAHERAEIAILGNCSSGPRLCLHRLGLRCIVSTFGTWCIYARSIVSPTLQELRRQIAVPSQKKLSVVRLLVESFAVQFQSFVIVFIEKGVRCLCI